MKTQNLKVPSHLTPASKKLWRQITEDYSIDSAAAPVLQDYLEAIELAERARAIIAVEGQTIRDRWGQIKVHPAIGTLDKASTAMNRAFRSLGLDLSRKP